MPETLCSAGDLTGNLSVCVHHDRLSGVNALWLLYGGNITQAFYLHSRASAALSTGPQGLNHVVRNV